MHDTHGTYTQTDCVMCNTGTCSAHTHGMATHLPGAYIQSELEDSTVSRKNRAQSHPGHSAGPSLPHGRPLCGSVAATTGTSPLASAAERAGLHPAICHERPGDRRGPHLQRTRRGPGTGRRRPPEALRRASWGLNAPPEGGLLTGPPCQPQSPEEAEELWRGPPTQSTYRWKRKEGDGEDGEAGGDGLPDPRLGHLVPIADGGDRHLQGRGTAVGTQAPEPQAGRPSVQPEPRAPSETCHRAAEASERAQHRAAGRLRARCSSPQGLGPPG